MVLGLLDKGIKMNAQDMLNAIQAKVDRELDITVTYARGQTLCQHYKVSPSGIEYKGRSWNGYGNLRKVYRDIVKEGIVMDELERLKKAADYANAAVAYAAAAAAAAAAYADADAAAAAYADDAAHAVAADAAAEAAYAASAVAADVAAYAVAAAAEAAYAAFGAFFSHRGDH